jgi:putative hemolysin
MPADFERCVKQGGRVRTKKIKGNKYIHICWLKGKSYAGEVKTAKIYKGKRGK